MPWHGENIYKRRDGRYEGRYVIGKTSMGKTRFGYIYGYQYAAVRNQLLQKKVEQLKKQNDSITDCTLLLKDLLQHWLENEVIGRVKQSSYQTYVRQINVHLLPKLGSLTLSEISSSVIYQFVAQLEASSMAYNSIKSVVRLLNAPFPPMPRVAWQSGLQLFCRSHKSSLEIYDWVQRYERRWSIWKSYEAEKIERVALQSE